MNPTIADAINNMQVLQFSYKYRERTVEPHAYGRTKDGRDVLRCYQVRGQSSSGHYTGWKLMDANKITGSISVVGSFQNERRGYKRNDKDMSTIYAQL